MFREKDRERKRERKETEKKRSRMTDCSTQRINILTPRMEKERERQRDTEKRDACKLTRGSWDRYSSL